MWGCHKPQRCPPRVEGKASALGLRLGNIQEHSVPYGPGSPTLSRSYDKQTLSSRVTQGKSLPGSTEELGEGDPGIAVKPVEFCFPVAKWFSWEDRSPLCHEVSGYVSHTMLGSVCDPDTGSDFQEALRSLCSHPACAGLARVQAYGHQSLVTH